MTKADAYWLIEELRKESFSKTYEEAFGIAQECIELVDLMPEHYVPVVRCKDCKYWAGEILGNRCRWHSGLEHMSMTPPDGFCSFGERRDTT